MICQQRPRCVYDVYTLLYLFVQSGEKINKLFRVFEHGI